MQFSSGNPNPINNFSNSDYRNVQSSPQQFYILKHGRLVFIAAKILDDILMTGEQREVSKIISGFNKKLQFGTVAHGPGNLRF